MTCEVHGITRGFFFFFQAEDGIRDYKVTGVQTCALPISRDGHRLARLVPQQQLLLPPGAREEVLVQAAGPGSYARSEERRVGKSVDLGGRRIIKKKKKHRRS